MVSGLIKIEGISELLHWQIYIFLIIMYSLRYYLQQKSESYIKIDYICLLIDLLNLSINNNVNIFNYDYKNWFFKYSINTFYYVYG